MDHHTVPRDAGRVFTQAAPGLAVYTHIVTLGDVPAATLIAETRETYDGPLVIGSDRMQFILADRGVTILEASK